MNNTAIPTLEKGLVFRIANSRVIVSRIFALVVLVLLLFTGHSFGQEDIVDVLFEVSGLFLLSICSLGRLWALMYISGNKRRDVVHLDIYAYALYRDAARLGDFACNSESTVTEIGVTV